MKNAIVRPNNQARRGSALLSAVIVSTVLAISATGFLAYLNHEYYLNFRSLHWTQALHLMETGVEEGFFEMNFRYLRGSGFRSENGWVPIGSGGAAPLAPLGAGDTGYSKSVAGFTDTNGVVVGNYVVQVINPGSANPYILAKGTVTNHPFGKSISRIVKVVLYQRPMFAFAFFARNAINLNGQNVETDSYISSNPTYSTNNRYDAAKRRDRGDVATNLAVVNAINVGNADVWGSAATGPGGSVAIGPNGRVGPFGTPAGTIAPGYFRDDTQVDLPPAALPSDFNIGMAPNRGNINNTTTITGGDYLASSISLAGNDILTFSGNVRIYVRGNISISGNAMIRVMAGSSVKIYADGPSVSIAGNAVANNAVTPDKFQLFGLPTVTSMSINGNGYFSGTVYAPDAALSLNGGGSQGDVSGAIVANSITLNGKVQLHYDEALKDTGPAIGYRGKSWEELTSYTE